MTLGPPLGMQRLQGKKGPCRSLLRCLHGTLVGTHVLFTAAIIVNRQPRASSTQLALLMLQVLVWMPAEASCLSDTERDVSLCDVTRKNVSAFLHTIHMHICHMRACALPTTHRSARVAVESVEGKDKTKHAKQ